ncbi:Mosc domain protein, partial [Globisporangium splendens]
MACEECYGTALTSSSPIIAAAKANMLAWIALQTMVFVAGVAAVAAAGSNGGGHQKGWQLNVQPTVVIGFTFAALVVTQLMLHFRHASRKNALASATSPVQCVLQKDDELEQLAENGSQVYPVGAVVATKTHGNATVLAYDAATETYRVEVDDDKNVVELAEKDVEVAEVVGFYVYPIKSCAGIRLDSVEITPKGVLHDRNWMFADENGKFITQRRYHKMALIVPKLLPNFENPKSILLTAKGMEPLEVPILREGVGKECNVRVWSSKMVAVDQGDEASEWINTFLADVRGDRKFRFFRVKDSFKRGTDPKYAPDFETGISDPAREPAKTLTRLRNGALLGFTDGKKFENYFGTNLVAERTGHIKVGAQVKVLTLKKEVFA